MEEWELAEVTKRVAGLGINVEGRVNFLNCSCSTVIIILPYQNGKGVEGDGVIEVEAMGVGGVETVKVLHLQPPSGPSLPTTQPPPSSGMQTQSKDYSYIAPNSHCSSFSITISLEHKPIAIYMIL